MHQKFLYVFAFGVLACAPNQDESFTSTPPPAVVLSLMGDTLRPVAMSEDLQRSRQQQLDAAHGAYESTPNNADSIIWYGRRLGYMGRYQDAIGVYTEGIEKHPNDARMYRHRGHRHITVRNLDAAEADFERAAVLIEGQPDEVEPDGLPNAMNIPTSTLQSNIWYHLGLTRYLQGDFPGARDAYVHGMGVSNNDDTLVATSYWYYMTLARLGTQDAAAAVLRQITTDMNVVENQSYQRLLLLFKGSLPVDSVLDVTADGDVALANATVTYGVGQYHALNGRMEQAREVWEGTIGGAQWAGFGYIAAEAELSRVPGPSS